MTLERIEHKVFASEAPLDEMGQFGSALATTKLNTKDVAEIQALPAYTKGWGSAIISENNYPAMEEMNGVLNVMSYHTGYLYQEGIPIYSATQTYSATSMVKSLDGESIYRSLKGDNKGNPLEDGTSWELFDFSKGALKTNQITNCLLEVPQRIKLELNNGTLTLKAGSEVIVPNGFEEDGTTPKFDYITVESDISVSLPSHGTAAHIVCVNVASSVLQAYIMDLQTFSGSSAPTVSYTWAFWYDTKNNIMKETVDSGATWSSGWSLPISIIDIVTGTGITSIDHVFNGMGYIGSTVWVDKGIKGLISNGRNEDGTLRNIEFVTDKLKTVTNASGLSQPLWYTVTSSSELYNSAIDYWIYDNEENLYKHGNDNGHFVVIAQSNTTNGVISNFQPKLPFRAVDYNDLQSLLPTGAVISSASSASPNGFLMANGSAISRTAYAKLFSVIGTTYGAGDGSTTFNLPNYSYYHFVTGDYVSVNGNGKALGLIVRGPSGMINAGLTNTAASGIGSLLGYIQGMYGTGIGTGTDRGPGITAYTSAGITYDGNNSGLEGHVGVAKLNWYIKY